MMIGVPKEVKDHESRVGITPAGVRALTEAGHKVLVETHAGELSAFPDDEYQSAGAEIVGSAHDVWAKCGDDRQGQGTDRRRTTVSKRVSSSSPICISRPCPTSPKSCSNARSHRHRLRDHTDERKRTLPLLTPMSEVAGRMSVQVGAYYLQSTNGGRGVLLGGVPGVPRDVVVIGGGVVGTNAAKMAVGIGAGHHRGHESRTAAPAR